MTYWVLTALLLLGALVIVVFVGKIAFKGAPSLANNEGRRYWAFLAILGGCIVFTLMAAVGVWLVSDNPTYSLYLALAAHVQILIGMSTFGFVLGRRMRGKAGRDGLEWDDSHQEPETPADGARLATDAAADVTEKLKDQER